MLHTQEELQKMIAGMEVVSDLFYRGAVQVGNHGFIEFAGFMNEYIKMCRQSLVEGGDFTEANTHVGKPLVMHDFNAAYLGEKFGCIFGTSFDNPSTIASFCSVAFGPKPKTEPGFRCGECGGSVLPRARPGRTREFKRGVYLSIPDDFEIPTCVACDEEYMSLDISEPLDAILGREFEKHRSEAMTKLPRVGDRYVYMGILRDAVFTVVEVDSTTGAIYLDTDDLDSAKLALNSEYRDRGGELKTAPNYAWIEKRELFAVNVEWDAWKLKTTPLIAHTPNRPQEE